MEDHIAERQLLCAVIEQAYLDAIGQGCGKPLMIDAQEWLNSDGKSPFSYIWICEQLQVDPSIIRRAVSSRTEKTLQVNRSEEKFIPTADWQIWKDGFLGLYHIKTGSNLSQRHAAHRRRLITRPQHFVSNRN